MPSAFGPTVDTLVAEHSVRERRRKQREDEQRQAWLAEMNKQGQTSASGFPFPFNAAASFSPPGMLADTVNSVSSGQLPMAMLANSKLGLLGPLAGMGLQYGVDKFDESIGFSPEAADDLAVVPSWKKLARKSARTMEGFEREKAGQGKMTFTKVVPGSLDPYDLKHYVTALKDVANARKNIKENPQWSESLWYPSKKFKVSKKYGDRDYEVASIDANANQAYSPNWNDFWASTKEKLPAWQDKKLHADVYTGRDSRNMVANMADAIMAGAPKEKVLTAFRKNDREFAEKLYDNQKELKDRLYKKLDEAFSNKPEGDFEPSAFERDLEKQLVRSELDDYLSRYPSGAFGPRDVIKGHKVLAAFYPDAKELRSTRITGTRQINKILGKNEDATEYRSRVPSLKEYERMKIRADALTDLDKEITRKGKNFKNLLAE